jgi:hypothetical protein
MTRDISLGLAVILILACVVERADAELLPFNDRAAWLAAAGESVPHLTEDFDSFSGTTNYGTPTGVAAGFLNFATVSSNFPLDQSWSIRETAGATTIPPVTTPASPYVLMVANNSGGNTLISFSRIGALGFDYGYSFPGWDPLGATPLTLVTSRGDSISDPNWTINDSSSGFVGILYDAGEKFTSIEIRDLSDDSAWFAADNFEAFIPEPSSIAALVSLGLCGICIGWYRRRKA